MRIVMLLSWLIIPAAAQEPGAEQLSPAEQESACAAQFSPALALVDKRSDPAVTTAKAAARPSLSAYFECRALAERNPRVCYHLKGLTTKRSKGPEDQDCMGEYYAALSIIDVLEKTNDGVKSCRDSLANAIGLKADAASLCASLSSGYARQTARSLCAGLPPGTLGSQQSCERVLEHYDAEPTACFRQKGKGFAADMCATKAALLRSLRSKDTSACRAIGICAAATARLPQLCEPYAKTAAATYCAAYVRTQVAQTEGGKYSAEESAAMKAAETKRLNDDLKRMREEKESGSEQ